MESYLKKTYYKILRESDNELVGLSTNPMLLEGFKVEGISAEEYQKLRVILWGKVQSS